MERYLVLQYRDLSRIACESEEDSLDQAALKGRTVYQSATTFHLKAMLYHAGTLTERGDSPGDLNPTEDVWKLQDPL